MHKRTKLVIEVKEGTEWLVGFSSLLIVCQLVLILFRPTWFSLAAIAFGLPAIFLNVTLRLK